MKRNAKITTRLRGLVFIGIIGGAAAMTSVMAGAQDSGTAQEPPRMSRERANQMTVERTENFTRVDDLETKLSTWDDFQRAGGSPKVTSIDPGTRVWVVRVKGEFTVNRAPRGVSPRKYPWAVVVYDADTEVPLATFAGPPGRFPSYFDSLPEERTT